MITQPGAGGFSDETFRQLCEALSAAFDTDLIQRHLAKLSRTEADERHLFLVVGVYDLPSPCSRPWVSRAGCPPKRLH
jgi:hypothetical protein